jgi:hypothetical protein
VTLTFDRERGVITVPLPNGLGKRTVTLIADVETIEQTENLPTSYANARPRVQEVRK